MLFKYTARDQNGKEVTGTISASSKLEAADQLYNESKLNVIGINQAENESAEPHKVEAKTKSKDLEKSVSKEPTKLHIGKAEEYKTVAVEKFQASNLKGFVGNIDNYLISHSKITAKDKAVFFRLLAIMINSGLSIVKSLRILSLQSTNKKLRLILQDITKDVKAGKNLSTTLSQHPIFNEAEIGMIAAGEASGQMNQTLLNLADSTERVSSLKSKVRSAMVYPIFVLIILALAVVTVMVLVIPSLNQLFEGTGVQLPLATRLLVGISNWFIGTTLGLQNIFWIILTILFGLMFIRFWKHTPSGKIIWDKLLINLPIFGALYRKSALAAFARELSLLSESGVEIIRSLEISANAVGNEVYKIHLMEVKEDVENGIPIHRSLENDELFPSMVVSMIAVGEETAQLSNVTKKIAEFYDEEISSFIKNLSSIMEPLIIIFVAVLVGGLIAAIMGPIMQITEIASQA